MTLPEHEVLAYLRQSVAAGSAALLVALLGRSLQFRQGAAVWRASSRIITVAAATTYAAYFTWQSCTRHRVFLTNGYDMAYITNILHNFVQGDSLYSSVAGHHLFGIHFSPILAILGLIYAAAPHAETLLILQAVILGGTGGLVYVLVHKQTASPLAATVLALLYLLNPLIHETNLFDFHEVVLAAPLILLIFLALEQGRTALSVVWMVLLMLVKEDLFLILVAIGLWLGIARGRPRFGASIVAAALLAGAFLIGVVIPAYRGEPHANAVYFGDAERFHELLTDMVSDPASTWRLMTSEDKLWSVARLLVPLGLLPLCSSGWILLFVCVEFLLASKPSVAGLAAHYGCVPAMMTLVAASLGFARLARRHGVWAHGILVFALIFSALDTYRRLSTKHVSPELTEHQRLAHRMLREIPARASVSAQSPYSAHLSNRRHIRIFPQGADQADVVLVDLKNPRYGIDPERFHFYVARISTWGTHRLIRVRDGILVFGKALDSGSTLSAVLVEASRVWFERHGRPAPNGTLVLDPAIVSALSAGQLESAIEGLRKAGWTRFLSERDAAAEHLTWEAEGAGP